MKFPATNHSSPSPDLNLTDYKLRLHRRRIRKSPGVRVRKYGTPAGRTSGLATPQERWKFDECRNLAGGGDNDSVIGRSGVRRDGGGGGGGGEVSVRKLAFGLWQLNLGDIGGVKCESDDRLGFEHGRVHVQKFPRHLNSKENGDGVKDLVQSTASASASASCSKNEILYELAPSSPFRKSAMERATKWDPVHSKTSDDVYRFYNHMRLLEDQQVATASVVSALQGELVQARIQIHELEAERQSAGKKLELFLRKLDEEKASWRSREHKKIHAVIDDLKNELNRERRNNQRMEIINSKLVNELANAKVSVKQFMRDCEKERKARELMEEVCNELANEIGEDKAEVEELKKESVKIRQEVEEERRMLQMAEVWREERVQMKLVDAKLTLEDKYCQMNKVIADLETFLRSRSSPLDAREMREAEAIAQAVNSVNIQDINEFSYVPPKPDDIFSIIKDIQNGKVKEWENEPYLSFSPMTHASKFHTEQKQMNGYGNHSVDLEDDGSGWETVSEAEDQGSSHSPEGRGGLLSKSETEDDESAGLNSPKSEISEVCSVSAKQSNKKASSVSKLWKSHPTNGEIHKMNSEVNGRLSNGTISSVGPISPDKGSGELAEEWGFPNSGNPHVTKGIKGCIEWPRGIHRSSLKARLLEARVESQKTQIRHVLKQKS